MKFTIPMKPKPKVRPRSTVTRTNKVIKGYMPKEYRQAQKAFRSYLGSNAVADILWDAPVSLTLVFCSADGRVGDIDNLIGFVLDCIQGVLIENDRQVVHVNALVRKKCGKDCIEMDIQEANGIG